MDQKELRALEARCIQEEPPACTARCPIHMDVRTFLKELSAGHWDQACQVLSTVMPFPGILARICDHPCEEVCKRSEVGGAISIGELERAALKLGRISRRFIPPPRKSQGVAVLGSGISGLTAALDLARKGYGVTLFEPTDRLGGTLWEIPESELPRDVIREETAVLHDLGVEIRLKVPLAGKDLFDTLDAEFGAVCVGTDSEAGTVAETDPWIISADPLTLAATRSGFFVGGQALSEAKFSPISAAADGRRAAISIDRYLQKVSMTAGREREGPYESLLFTNLEGIPTCPVVPMKNSESGYSDEETRAEAARCLQCECMECVKKCLFMRTFKAYPKRYVRQVSNDATMVLGAHGPTRKLVNSCTLCDLCTVLCPNDFPMAGVCMEGRRYLTETGKMPASCHEFALDDMASANSAKATLAFHEPGRETSRFVFFPGCQLSGIYPEHVLSVYAHLRNHLAGGVGLMLRCCGVPAKWAANDDLFDEAARGVEEDWNELGRPTMIVACPTCYQTLRERLPDIEILSLWQTLVGISAEPGSAQQGQGPRPQKLAIHDPCTARHETDIQDAVRSLLTRLGYTIEELPLSRTETECCGFGGLMSTAHPPLAKEVAKMRASLSEADYVTYCAMCRNTLAAAGKRVMHVLDLLFTVSTADPAAARPCGWSERRENRYSLKERLVKTLWKGGRRTVEEHEAIVLHISREVMESMEERRILVEDVQRVIDHAERTGNRVHNRKTDRWLASFRPRTVTYWVEYAGTPDGYTVHNAYSHRMEIVGEL